CGRAGGHYGCPGERPGPASSFCKAHRKKLVVARMKSGESLHPAPWISGKQPSKKKSGGPISPPLLLRSWLLTSSRDWLWSRCVLGAPAHGFIRGTATCNYRDGDLLARVETCGVGGVRASGRRTNDGTGHARVCPILAHREDPVPARSSAPIDADVEVREGTADRHRRPRNTLTGKLCPEQPEEFTGGYVHVS